MLHHLARLGSMRRRTDDTGDGTQIHLAVGEQTEPLFGGEQAANRLIDPFLADLAALDGRP